MMDSFLFVISVFSAVFAFFVLVGFIAARLRLKRSEKLMEEMVKDYEQAYAQNPDDGFLRDNIIELRHHQWRQREKDKK